MKRFQDFLYRLPPLLLSSIASVLTVAQIVIAFLLRKPGSETLEWAGWICLWVSGIFGLLPIFTFRKKGGVPEGESYMKTSVLVDTGIYAIVRHPQGGTAWLLINFGIMLISSYWVCIVLGLISMVLVYVDTFKTDQSCIEKFGEDYERYREKVPRVNFVAGIFRLLKKAAENPEIDGMSAAHKKWFAWSPDRDTVAALLTEILMIALYWTTTHLLGGGWDDFIIFGVITNLILNVLFPVWWIAFHRRQPLSELGITTKRWLSSLLIGIMLAAFASIGLRQMAAGINWLPQVLYNAVILWEPFFVFSWLQLRFDRAFGIIPGILLAGLCFAAYHIGSYPPAMLATLLVIGMVYAGIFRLTSNLLILWPLVWAVSSSIGTLMGGMQFTWEQVAIWSAILLIQLAFIGWAWRR